MTADKVDSSTPILLAEGDPEVLSRLQDLLGEFQFTNVTVVRDAQSLIRADGANRYSLIFLGSTLAGMGPFKVMAILKASGENAETPIVFLYGREEASLIERASAAGAVLTLEKPVQEDALRATIEKYLESKVVTRTEEEDLSSQYIGAVSLAVEAVKERRAQGRFDEGEAAFQDALLELFASTEALCRDKGDAEVAAKVREEAGKVFPDLEERLKRRAQRGEDSPAPAESGEAAGSPEGDRVGGGIPILVAEADPNAAAELQGLLDGLNFYNVTVVSEGFEVLSLDESTAFSLIFLSSSLSDMNPVKVNAALKAGEKNAETPIVLLHKADESDLAGEARKSGIPGALERPVREEALREGIESLLGKRVSSKAEEQEHSAQYLLIAAGTVQAVKNLREAGVYEGAEVAFLDLLEELFMCTGELYLSKGSRKLQEELLREARPLFPEIASRFGERADSFLGRGAEFIEKEEFERARAEFEAALTLNPISIEANVGLGESYLGIGNVDAMTAAFERAIHSEEPPSSPHTLNRLGLVACRHEHFAIALAAFDRLLSVYQLDAKLYYNKALVHVRMRDMGKALPLLSRALTLDDEFTAAKVLHKKVRSWMRQIPEVAQQNVE